MLIGATLAWSTSGLFARAITVDTPTMILWRGLAGAAGLMVVLWWLKGSQGFRDFGRLGEHHLRFSYATSLEKIDAGMDILEEYTAELPLKD